MLRKHPLAHPTLFALFIGLASFDANAAPNKAPTITGTPSTIVEAGNLYNFTPQAADANRDPLTFSIANKPAWAVFNTKTGNLSGTPTSTYLGTTQSNISIKVTDGKSTPVALPNFSITVLKPNTLPVLQVVQPQSTIEVGKPYSFTPSATDADNDTLTFSIVNKPAWLQFNTATGQLSGTPSASNVGSFKNIIISVTDGRSAPIAYPSFNIDVISTVDNALITGDASNTTITELLDAGIATAQSSYDLCKTTLDTIYPVGLETTNFTIRSAYFNSTSYKNIPLHVNLKDNNANIYSWVGEKNTGNRYAVLGTNVFGFTGVNTDLKNSTLATLKWILKQSNAVDVLSQKLTVLMPDTNDQLDFKTWLSSNGLTSQWILTTDTNLLTTGAYDLYLANAYRSVSEVKSVLAANKPLVLFNHWYQPSDTLLAEFDLKWRWYGEATIGNALSVTDQCDQGSSLKNIQTTLSTLKAGLPNFAYDDLNCIDSVGRITCYPELVTDASGTSLNKLFMLGATNIKNHLNALDAQGKNIFKLGADENLYKLAVLLGDKYRALVTFPMDKVTTADTTFYQSIFADNSIHYSRANNPYQPDLGDFTSNQTVLNSTATIDTEGYITPTNYSEWTSVGLYAPPGKPVTISRTDTNTNIIKLKINYLRKNTFSWNPNQYSRPLYMTSPEIELKPGQSYTFSTPHGGPIYIGWVGVTGTAPTSRLTYSGFVSNPLLLNFDTASVQTFSDQVKTTYSNWIDIKTPYAEIHTLKPNLLKSLDQQDGVSGNGYTVTDVQNYISDLNNYLIAGNYSYAGFTGVGLPALSTEVSSFCTTLGLDNISYGGTIKNLCTDSVIHAKPAVQHINSDVHATCGSLCSGNPFDSDSGIRPLDWGENHEMGHNLQRSRLKIYDGRSVEVSNNIFPMHTQWKWTVDNKLAKHPSQTRPNYPSAFKILQAAISTGTLANANHPLWSGTGTYDNAFERLAFYIQLAYSEQSWDFYTKAYIMERILTDAVRDTTDAKWNAVKAKLGMANYSRTAADAITGNDFLYLMASNVAGKNYIKFFNVWGIEVSSTAQQQVADNGYTTVVDPVFYYVNNELPAAMPTQADAIPLDGVRTWADPTP